MRRLDKKWWNDNKELVLGFLYLVITGIYHAFLHLITKIKERRKRMSHDPSGTHGPPTPPPGGSGGGTSNSAPRRKKGFSLAGAVFSVLMIFILGGLGFFFWGWGGLIGGIILGVLMAIGVMKYFSDLIFDLFGAVGYLVLHGIVLAGMIGGGVLMVIGIGGTFGNPAALEYLAILQAFLAGRGIEFGYTIPTALDNAGGIAAVYGNTQSQIAGLVYANLGALIMFVASFVGFVLDDPTPSKRLMHWMHSGFSQVTHRLKHMEFHDEDAPGEGVADAQITKFWHEIGIAFATVAGAGGIIAAVVAYRVGILSIFPATVLATVWLIVVLVVTRKAYYRHDPHHDHDGAEKRKDLKPFFLLGMLALLALIGISAVSAVTAHEEVTLTKDASRNCVAVRAKVAKADAELRMKLAKKGVQSLGGCYEPKTMANPLCVELASCNEAWGGKSRAEILEIKQQQAEAYAPIREAEIEKIQQQAKRKK